MYIMYKYVHVYTLYICKKIDCFTKKSSKKHLFFNNFSMSSTEVSLTSKKSKFQEDSLRYFVYVIFIPLVTK